MDMKLFAVDMDETAVNSKHRITKETEAALKKAAEKGILVVPVTGRCLEGLPMKIREMNHLFYIITSNGAKVYDCKNQKVVYRKLIPNDTACEVLKICQEFKVGIAIHSEGKCYDNSKLQALYRYLAYHKDFKAHKVIGDLCKWIKENKKPLEKIQIFSSDEKKLNAIKMKLMDFKILELSLSTSGYIEITHREAKKGNALRYLCKYLGISLNEVMAIGDNTNDYSMLLEAGCPIAMGNANKEIKELAKYVTLSNDENGVAEAVYRYLL